MLHAVLLQPASVGHTEAEGAVCRPAVHQDAAADSVVGEPGWVLAAKDAAQDVHTFTTASSLFYMAGTQLRVRAGARLPEPGPVSVNISVVDSVGQEWVGPLEVTILPPALEIRLTSPWPGAPGVTVSMTFDPASPEDQFDIQCGGAAFSEPLCVQLLQQDIGSEPAMWYLVGSVGVVVAASGAPVPGATFAVTAGESRSLVLVQTSKMT